MMIKKRVFTCLIILLGFILQTTVLQYVRLAGVVPNLLLIITVFSGYMRGRTDGMLTGFLCGLLSDMVFGTVIGFYALVLVVIGYAVGYSNRIYYNDDFSMPLILVGVSDLVANLLYYAGEFLLRGRLNLGFYFVHIILPEIVYTMVISVILFKLLSSAEHWLTPLKEEEV